MWLDKLLEQVQQRLNGANRPVIINDSKTPSGRVHVGSLRGVLIHDATFKMLKRKGIDCKFMYCFDDYDPMDGLPFDAPDALRAKMGLPLCQVNVNDQETMSEQYGSEFLDTFNKLDVAIDHYKTSQLYAQGVFNQAIDIVLSKADIIHGIYKKLYDKTDTDLPFQVICESCGNIASTRSLSYDGTHVTYECSSEKALWAKGCGHKGKVSPFDGNGKLPWKVEWAAKWFTFGVDIEGAGKDHCTKGGSRDVSDKIARQVFDITPPINIPYEFFLVSGAKMSSSKGVGASAKAMTELLPANIMRFLMIQTEPKKTVNFDYDEAKIVKIFNDYDTFCTQSADTDVLNIIQAQQHTQKDGINFQTLLALLNMPHIDLMQELAKHVNDVNNKHLKERISCGQAWLDQYTDPNSRYILREEPDDNLSLSTIETHFLFTLCRHLQSANDWSEEGLQTVFFDAVHDTPINPKQAFETFYKAFFGRTSGPKAGNLLVYLGVDFVERFVSVLPQVSKEQLAQEAMISGDALQAILAKKGAPSTVYTDTIGDITQVRWESNGRWHTQYCNTAEAENATSALTVLPQST